MGSKLTKDIKIDKKITVIQQSELSSKESNVKVSKKLPYTKYESDDKILKTLEKNSLSEFNTTSQNSSNYEIEK